MISIADIINFLETRAPLTLQESYDNAGLICGDRKQVCSGAITSLDLTEQVLEEAIEKNSTWSSYTIHPSSNPLKAWNLKIPSPQCW